LYISYISQRQEALLAASGRLGAIRLGRGWGRRGQPRHIHKRNFHRQEATMLLGGEKLRSEHLEEDATLEITVIARLSLLLFFQVKMQQDQQIYNCTYHFS
jgi:hypothetical protein